MKDLLKSLRPATKRWIRSVKRNWDLEQHHLRLLLLAGEAWDRSQCAREVLESEGSFIDDRFSQRKAHPAVAVEKDSMMTFAKMLRALSLDIGQPEEYTRPGR